MSLRETVQRVLDATPVIDLHTHLFAPEFGPLNLWGIDELLTYHYLVAESLRAEPDVTPEQFFALDKTQQADFVWRVLFKERTPLSEATVGVVDVLTCLGLDATAPLRDLRAWFAEQAPWVHLDRVLRLSGVEGVTMTNDPFDPSEAMVWRDSADRDPRFFSALRIDALIHSFADVECHFHGPGESILRANRFLDTWVERMNPRYVACSFPPEFCFCADGIGAQLIRDVVLPTCRRHGLPFALMIGVKRRVNPRLRSAGDGMGVADLSSLSELLDENSDIRFLVTTLSRENAHHLCVLGRKFANLSIFGCWWFVNNPSLVEEITDMRLEMLGDTFVPQHSDARVTEQLIYKWRHARAAVATSLTKRFSALEAAGVAVHEEKIEKVARTLLRDNALKWMNLAS